MSGFHRRRTVHQPPNQLKFNSRKCRIPTLSFSNWTYVDHIPITPPNLCHTHEPHAQTTTQEQLTKTSNVINLKGSTEIVQEFFFYSINSILYQRGIYPPDAFSRVPKYGLAMLISADDELTKYLDGVLRQLAHWLMQGEVQRLVMVVTGVDSKTTLERWVFNVETDKDVVANPE
jgi:hypothetical protein